MTTFAKLTPTFSVAGQLTIDDVNVAAEQGFKSLINNRPDGEGSDQPASADIAAAAGKAGLAYLHVPAISGKLTDADVLAMKTALKDLEGPVLAFCRTGTRSATLWALVEAGSRPVDDILKAVSGAGYDLSGLRPRLEQANAKPEPAAKTATAKGAAKPKPAAKTPPTSKAKPEKPVTATKTAAKTGKKTTATTKTATKTSAKSAGEYDVVIVGGGAAGIAVASSMLRRAPAMRVAIIEPSDVHHYQPAWTLVGGGVFDQDKTHRAEGGLIPRGAKWIQAAANTFDPDNNAVILDGGEMVGYRALVVCPGLKLDWKAVEGLPETLGKNGVTSNYMPGMAPYTWSLVQKMKGGRALFTQPPMPIKCAGAPQKAMYLSCSYWEQAGVLRNIEVEFNNAGEVLFGVTPFVPPLMEYVKRYNAALSFKSNLRKVDGPAKKAWFEVTDKDGKKTTEEKSFDMLHVCPPQTAPDFIRDSPLSDKAGWVEVNQQTLQHVRYPNIFGLGDACSAPNAKTAAAVRKQSPVVVQNLSAFLAGQEPRAIYEGYGSCPLTVERGKAILAEFGYGGELQPTFPLDPVRPRWIWWMLKTKILPYLYWDLMLKGREWLARPKPPTR